MNVQRLGPGSLVLITGGAGFVGAAVARRLAGDGLKVRILDDLSSGSRAAVAGLDAELVVEDVRSERSMRDAMRGAHAVIHLAAAPPRPRTAREERHAHDVTVTGTWNVLSAARQAGVVRVIVASSAAVYGARPPFLLNEEMTTLPSCAEGAQKLAVEAYMKLFAARDGLAACALRLFSVYGPGQPAGDGGPLVARFVHQALNREPLTIHGDGSQTRDLVHVTDVAAAFAAALAAPGVGGRVINVGSGEGIAVRHVAAMVTDLAGGALPAPRYLPARTGEPRDLRASLAAATSTLGYRPRTRLCDGLAGCLAVVPAAPRPATPRPPPPPPKPRAVGTPLPMLFDGRPPSWELPES